MNAPHEGHLEAADGLGLWWGHWPANGRERAVLLNVPGLGDHTGLYPAITGFFPSHGYTVFGLDTRGNGRSPGRRGHVDRWATYRDDLRRFIEFVRERASAPVILLGHSLGGLMVLDCAIEHHGLVSGVAAASPPLGTLGTSPLLLALARVLSRVVPAFTFHTGLDLSGIAHDPAIPTALLADPLFHRRASARLATETLATIARVHAKAAALREPVLLLHGAKDRMVSIDGSRRLAAAHPGRVRLIEYPEGWHALFSDVGYEQRLAHLESWISSLSL
jgi:alpha-beta hydrolase superfamily lysophospholipase